jgi:tRNA threonylcarbamoyladenosine biosynthesis protein TsaE
MPPRLELPLPEEAATAQLGQALASAIGDLEERIERSALSIGLRGELGAGKTSLIRAALRKLGVSGTIRSPTYALLELYPLSRLNFYHFDFYRFSDPSEFDSLGFRDYFRSGSVCAIEWPERVGVGKLPIDLQITLQHAGAGRTATVEALTEMGVAAMQSLQKAWFAFVPNS